MGTPFFAAPSLQAIIDSKEHKVVAVFTAPPKSKGRGLHEAKSPIHSVADQYQIPVYTPKTLRSSEVSELISSIDADIIVVVAYGFIVPKNILEAKKYGCLNIHPSKLPKYRGAAPLQRTVINGDTETAVCIMQMDEGLDTGDIILEQNFALKPDITLTELHDKCSNLGAELLIKVLDQIELLPRIPQTEMGLEYAHKLTKEEGRIDWNLPASKIDCMVRGMNPWPGAFFTLDGKLVKILESEVNLLAHKYSPGTVISKDFEIACGSGSIKIKKLQQEGKKALDAKDFLNGVSVPVGMRLV